MNGMYPLVIEHSYGKWTIEIGDLPIQIAICQSYAKLPKGKMFLFFTQPFIVALALEDGDFPKLCY